MQKNKKKTKLGKKIKMTDDRCERKAKNKRHKKITGEKIETRPAHKDFQEEQISKGS